MALVAWIVAAVAQQDIELVLKGDPPKTHKGQLIRENLKHVIVTSDKGWLTINWTDVESVRGKPAREHVAALKEAKKDWLCPDCRGGIVAAVCYDCLGSRKQHPKLRPCDACGGKGTTGAACPAKCRKGLLDCPEPCLKRTAGVWKTTNTGVYRMFVYRDGNVVRQYGKSLKHLGELLEFKEVKPFGLSDCKTCKGGANACSECRKAGTFVEALPKSLGVCRRCARSITGGGSLPCESCHGVGGLLCEACCGAKQVPEPDTTVACGTCTAGIFKCRTCQETGFVDPKTAPLRPQPWQEELRTSLPKLVDAWPAATERLFFVAGHAVEGAIVQRLGDSVTLALPAQPDGSLPVLGVHLAKHPYRRASLKTGAPKETPAPQTPPTTPPPPAPKTPGPDTVTLKDGTVLKGKILMRSDDVILIETDDGKRVRVEMDKVKDVKSEPKK